MSKRIKGRQAIEGRIKTHGAPTTNYDQKPPVFSLQFLSSSHGVAECSNDEKAAILDAFHRRSSTTWAQLKSAHRHGLGAETINKKCLKVTVPSCVTPDTAIMAFRCINKAPMLGFREQDRFHVIWIDRNFDCYDHA